MSPDNYYLWKRHDEEQEEELGKLPICADCGEPIQTDYCFEFNGEYYCEDCLIEYHRHDTDDFI